MERNANDSLGNENFGGSTDSAGSGYGAETSSVGGTGGTSSGSNGGSSSGSFSRDESPDASSISDRAKSAASSAGDKLADVGSTVRNKAGNLKTTIADALQSGAERLRQQSAGSGQIAGASATGGSTDMIADDTRLAQTSNQLAGGMQGAADWLRDADIDGLKSGIERQVKEHPARSLAVAVGVGYLLGKAFRK